MKDRELIRDVQFVLMKAILEALSEIYQVAGLVKIEPSIITSAMVSPDRIHLLRPFFKSLLESFRDKTPLEDFAVKAKDMASQIELGEAGEQLLNALLGLEAKQELELPVMKTVLQQEVDKQEGFVEISSEASLPERMSLSISNLAQTFIFTFNLAYFEGLIFISIMSPEIKLKEVIAHWNNWDGDLSIASDALRQIRDRLTPGTSGLDIINKRMLLRLQGRSEQATRVLEVAKSVGMEIPVIRAALTFYCHLYSKVMA